MTYAWIVYSLDTLKSGFHNNAFDWMVSEAKTRGIELDVLFSENIIFDETSEFTFKSEERLLRKPDFVLMRSYDFVLSRALESKGVRLINSSMAMFVARNKALTSVFLNAHSVPTPKTIYANKSSYTETLCFFDGKSFVLKTPIGSKGEGVFLIDSERKYNDLVAKHGYPLQFQEYIAESRGMDIRSYVVGNRVVGAVKRISDSDFRSNFSLGGRVELVELTEEIVDISLRAAKAVGLEFAGIDLLMSDRGLLVCEVNGNAGFRSITSVSDIDMVKLLFDYIVDDVNLVN